MLNEKGKKAQMIEVHPHHGGTADTKVAMSVSKGRHRHHTP